MVCEMVMNALEKIQIRIGNAGGLVLLQFCIRYFQAERAKEVPGYRDMHTGRKVRPWGDGSGKEAAQA